MDLPLGKVWLAPAIAELDNNRVVIAKINDMTDT